MNISGIVLTGMEMNGMDVIHKETVCKIKRNIFKSKFFDSFSFEKPVEFNYEVLFLFICFLSSSIICLYKNMFFIVLLVSGTKLTFNY